VFGNRFLLLYTLLRFSLVLWPSLGSTRYIAGSIKTVPVACNLLRKGHVLPIYIIPGPHLAWVY
jgi:hypothetical protein